MKSSKPIIAFAAFAAFGLAATPSNAATKAYWRFENPDNTLDQRLEDSSIDPSQT